MLTNDNKQVGFSGNKIAWLIMYHIPKYLKNNAVAE